MRDVTLCEPLKPIAVPQATLSAHLFQHHKVSLGQARIRQCYTVTLKKMRYLSERVDTCQVHVINKVEFAVDGGLAVVNQYCVDVNINQGVTSFSLSSTQQLGAVQNRMVALPAHQRAVSKQTNFTRYRHVFPPLRGRPAAGHNSILLATRQNGYRRGGGVPYHRSMSACFSRGIAAGKASTSS